MTRIGSSRQLCGKVPPVRPLSVIALTLFAGSIGAFCAGIASAAESAVDYARLADIVVNRSWQLEPGERVVIFSDASRDRGMAGALRAAIARAGGQIEEIAAPDSHRDAALTPETRAARDAQWQAVFARSQAAIWLPSDLTAVDDYPFEHQVEASRVRSVHFHWFLPPDAQDIPMIEQMYQRAIEIGPAEMARRTSLVEQAIIGQTVHVRAANGTDLTFRVPANAHVHQNTGLATREKVAGARSVRDREEELPGGLVRTTDIVGAEGTFVGYVSWDTRSGLVEATLHGGRVTRLRSLRGAESQVRAWRQATGAKDLPGEFVVSTNPALPAVIGSGFMPYYGYGAGIVRLALGDNWESGGTNRSSNGEMLLFLPGATLTAGGRTLIRSGTFIDP